MNAVAHIGLMSAYSQLKPAEKGFVDAYVTDLEREAEKRNERISLALYRPLDAATIDASRGLLEKPIVRAAVAERINEIAAANELSVQRVVKELVSISFASIGHYMELDEFTGEPKFTLSRCTPEQLAAVKKIKITEGGRGARSFEFELHDKLSGIEKLMRFTGMGEGNPYWRSQQAQPALPGGVTVDNAADAYARMIEG